MSRYKILFKITGSIAAYKSVGIISKLVQNECDVKVAATESALKFIGPATLEGLTGNQVYTDSFAANQVMNHIDLVKWADLVILCPATANTINKLANGIGDNLITSLFLAHDWLKPYLIAPAMNTRMYNHPATQESLQKLTDWGVQILPVAEGYLACGETGDGKLLEPDKIYDIISEALVTKTANANPKKILITSGGTRESIDGVRFISNLSTGKTGALITDFMNAYGHEVTFLYAKESALPKNSCEKIEYVSFNDLNDKLKGILSSNFYDAIIHLAAVSDYSPTKLEYGDNVYELPVHKKINSDVDTITISFKKNLKIVDMLKSYSSNKNIIVIAFKLTSGATYTEKLEAIRKILDKSSVDIAVSNDFTDRVNGNIQTNFLIFNKNYSATECNNVSQLSKALNKIIIGVE